MPTFLATTPRSLEPVAASRIEDLGEDVETRVRPEGMMGLVLVEADLTRQDLLEVSEVHQAVRFERVLEEPSLKAIAASCGELAGELPSGATFAVRCRRRGSHDWSSQDVEREAGTAVLDAGEDLEVDLTRPDHVVRVEVIEDRVGIGVLPGEAIRRKWLDKPETQAMTSKVTLVQRLYEASPKGVERIGAAVGRSAQAFEVRRLVVVVDQPADARTLTAFLEAVEDGIASRHRVQRDASERKVRRVPVQVHELHQMVRMAHERNAVSVMTDPRGPPLVKVAADVGQDLREAKRIYVFHGSDRGLPPGSFAPADHVVDLAPKVTYGTDQAITASIIGLLHAFQEG